jgi:hypothetical protein
MQGRLFVPWTSVELIVPLVHYVVRLFPWGHPYFGCSYLFRTKPAINMENGGKEMQSIEIRERYLRFYCVSQNTFKSIFFLDMKYRMFGQAVTKYIIVLVCAMF